MFQKKVLGDQLNITDVATEISASSNALALIATGITTDPGSIALFNAEYLRLDNGNVMLADLDIDNNNIINVGNVDGRDVSADGTVLDGHVADGTIHFLQAVIDHTAILNVGSTTHADIDTHIADLAIHFNINDLSTTTTDVWSGVKIDSELILKTDQSAFDSHTGDATIHFLAGNISHLIIQDVGSNTHANIDTHIADGTKHYLQSAISITESQIVPDYNFYEQANANIQAHIIDFTNPHLTSLDGLTDVTVAAATIGQVLTLTGSPGTWTAATPSFSPLTSDFDTAGFSIITLDTVGDVSVNDIVIKAGDNNYGGKGSPPAYASFYAGSVNISAGASYGYYNMPGQVNIRGGNTDQYGTLAGSPYNIQVRGDVNIISGDNTGPSGYAGHVNIQGGTAPGGYAGNVNISGGDSNNDGGDINIQAGATNDGGNILLRTGTNGNGIGEILIYAGDGSIESASIVLHSTNNRRVILQAPSAPATHLTFILPATTPTADEYLTGTGGTLNWAKPPTTLLNDSAPKLSNKLDTDGNDIVTGGGNGLAIFAQLLINDGTYIPKGFGGSLTGSPPTGDQDNGLDLLSGLSYNSMNFVTASNAYIRAHTTAFKIYGGGNNPTTSKGILELYTADTGPKYLFSNSITLSANDATTGKIDFVFPVDGGIAGEVLLTDGNGVMSWGSSFTSAEINNQSIPGVGSPLVYTYTLTPADIGTFIVVNQNAANTVEIPAGTTFPVGARFELTQLGTANTTITVGGGENLLYKGGTESGTSVVVTKHQEAKLTKIDATNWFVAVSGTTA